MHVSRDDGKRYLFLSGGDRVRLSDDGLATDGPVEHVYDPWRYPETWDVESFVTLRHSVDGRQWRKFDVQMEVSGYHHNVAGDFLSLRPAIYVAGKGEARIRGVRYEAL
ncbi:MAG: hypothetical protein ACREV5_01955 [Steroidobacter sp.]